MRERPDRRNDALEAGFLRCAWLVAIVLTPACGDSDSGSAVDGSVTWSTEAEYSFSGAPEQDVLFSWVPVTRVDPYRDRVFVLDMQDTEVSVWTPEGSLVFVVGGKGEGPGEFVYPTRIEFEDSSSFYVREGSGSRFTYYAPDGNPGGNRPGRHHLAHIPGLSVDAGVAHRRRRLLRPAANRLESFRGTRHRPLSSATRAAFQQRRMACRRADILAEQP